MFANSFFAYFRALSGKKKLTFQPVSFRVEQFYLEIAPLGQTSAHVPHSVQMSGSIE